MVNKICWVGATSPITIRQGGEGPPAGDHHSRPLHRVVSGVGGTTPQPNYLLLFDINVYQYILSQYSEKAPTGAKVPTGTSLNIEKTMYKTSTSMSKLLKSITHMRHVSVVRCTAVCVLVFALH